MIDTERKSSKEEKLFSFPLFNEVENDLQFLQETELTQIFWKKPF